MGEWFERACACPCSDPHECIRLRYGTEASDEEGCMCICHDEEVED